MGIEVTLHRDGERLSGLPDPNGGSFAAAGDFDELLGSPELPFIGALDPYGDATLSHLVMDDLIADVNVALARARPGRQLRGLRRLRVMAEMVKAQKSLTLRVLGD
ncbi:hypothetical protein [Nocardioides sp.]|uniref:hypothetical protein n=1 Tax=Nocardioides sp. TaxID=35761 RepID=UPI003783B864